MSAAGLLAPAPAAAGAPTAPEYYPEEDDELESAEDDERSCRGRESDEGASYGSPGGPGRGRGRGAGAAWERGGRGRGRACVGVGGAAAGRYPVAAWAGGSSAYVVPFGYGKKDVGRPCQSRRSL